MSVGRAYLESALFELRRAKRLGAGALGQLRDDGEWHRRADAAANSVAILVQHLWGNMLSRWTDFLTTDGEKDTRRRDAEFEDQDLAPDKLRRRWEEGWARCLDTLGALTEADLERTVHIRGEPLTVLEAIQRQVAHYSYHVGQIAQLVRHLRGAEWRSLSIPRGKSADLQRGTYKRDG